VWLEGVFGRTGAGPWQAAAVAAAIVMALGMVALLGLRETYGIDLDYEER